MNASSDGLRSLADHLGKGHSADPRRFREDLEASLVPLIRCAIRTGVGAPPLVQWVRRNLPAGPVGRPADPAPGPDRAAPLLARQLCAELLRHYRARHGLETVAGR